MSDPNPVLRVEVVVVHKNGNQGTIKLSRDCKIKVDMPDGSSFIAYEKDDHLKPAVYDDAFAAAIAELPQRE